MKFFPSIGFLIIAILSVMNGYAQPRDKKKASAKAISLADALKPFYDIQELPVYMDNTSVAQVSSYDTTGGNNDGFNGTYSFLRRNPDSSLVIFDMKGPGIINRIWTPTATNDTLDFFIDDATLPALTIRFSDLFSGNVSPFVKPLCGNELGGSYCYFPILFNKSCRIVCRAKKIQFHQIQYRLYPRDIRLVSFTGHVDKDEAQKLTRIARFWGNNKNDVYDFLDSSSISNEIETFSTDILLNPGESKTIFDLNKAGRIMGIEFENDKGIKVTRDIDLKITWDDETNPAVYCPLTDFFGYAFGNPSMQSLLSGSQADVNYSYYPMPFDKKAKIELIYRKTGSSGNISHLKLKLNYLLKKRDPVHEGKFYTCWNSNQLKAGAPAHVFLNSQGKGHYVATILQARNLKAGMTYFFEGDDSTAIDGKPEMHGTGSEDYFNGGWYAFPDKWDAKKSMPLYGCLDYSLPFSRTGGYRLFITDKMSFNKSIFHSIEHGPVGNSMPVDYTSLAFYYCDQPPANFLTPTNELTKLWVPDTLMFYPQLLDFNIWGNTDIKSIWATNSGGLSFIFSVNDETRIRFPLTDLPAGKYKIFADITKTPEGASFSLWHRQTPLSEWTDSYNPTKERAENVYLADIDADNHENLFTFYFKTSKTKNSFFLNRLILVRQP